MSWSLTLLSRSGPVGLPSVPWTERKTSERELGRAKDLSAPLYCSDTVNININLISKYFNSNEDILIEYN
jgi:hypothetical protein